MDLADCGAAELGRLFRSGAASPVEATQAVLQRIDRREPAINAFVLLDRDGALRAAAAAEQRFGSNEPLGPLDGVTATVKDMLDLVGTPTRRGSRITSSAPAPADTPAVARLRAAGCVLLGKTTTSEQGWSGLSFSPLTGLTHNPHRPGVTSGGSSAGAAAAAAAGMGALHIGTDGAGSVRLPAHFCGVVGMKATFGTVPNVPLPNNDGLSHTGPIVRSVVDAALMLRCMAGAHAGDPTSIDANHLHADPVPRLRIAYSPDLGHLRVDPEVRDAVAAAVQRIAQAGAHVEEVRPAWGAEGAAIMAAYWSILFRHHLQQPDAALAQLDPAFLASLRDGVDMSLPDYVALRGRRLAYAAAVNRWLSEFDLLLTPTASVVAFNPASMRPAHWPPHAHDWLAWAGFTYPFNLSHSPAISIPAGLAASGLPVGLQLVAPRLRDGVLLQAAAWVEGVLACTP